MNKKNNIQNYYKNIVIGGGIIGVGIFRDLTLHKEDVLLIDKHDFSSQTSQHSSKMLHGGIRYLENFDFDLVKEALLEKNLWKTQIPHVCQEKSFHLPIYNFSKYPLEFLRIGFMIYDFLSSYTNSPYSILYKKDALTKVPVLKKNGLRGCGVYHDVIIDDLKFTFEVLFDALKYGGQAENYLELIEVKLENKLYTLTLKNQLTGSTTKTTCHNLIFATGPFTDKLLHKLNFIKWVPQLLPSKGIHLWISKKDIPLKDPVVLQTNDNRVLFIIPHSKAVLIGTTESVPNNDYFNIEITDQEINYLLENINQFFDLNITKKHILTSYAGIRPLVKSENSNELGKTSRHHKVIRPQEGLHIIIGGKYTTFRSMAVDIVRPIILKNNKSYSSQISKQFIPQHSEIINFKSSEFTSEKLKNILENEYVKTENDLIRRRLSIYSKSHIDDLDLFKSKLHEMKHIFEEFGFSFDKVLEELRELDIN